MKRKIKCFTQKIKIHVCVSIQKVIIEVSSYRRVYADKLRVVKVKYQWIFSWWMLFVILCAVFLVLHLLFWIEEPSDISDMFSCYLFQ